MSPEGRSSNSQNDKIFISRAGWFILRYPEAWEIQEDRECVTLCEPVSGVGALAISSYSVPGPRDAKGLLLEFLESQGIIADRTGIAAANSADSYIASYEYIAGEKYLKAWAIVRRDVLVLVTYNCKKGLEQRERRVVEDIVKSIRVLSQEHPPAS
jgi:hypothetical protein